ncbi:cupin domain-containing protein [Nannocystis punicea]|uniref:Cupin domain-containing protein n=1 Tax=Nannocystis punicea TaxID=2995304 RepID=A0ABY7GW96_9BACT|nr:cupin domain-containing protein [Nannocystis poenicansa]WAS91202.1 cupin domain-containing protein [Nannocystis poenicansa]
MKVLDLPAAFGAAPTAPGAALFLAAFVAGPCRVGVVARTRGSTDGAWERHDGGDELLVIFKGRARFTIEPVDGATEVVEVGPAQALLLPRGAAHSAEVLEDLQVFFVSPGEGNHEWSAPTNDAIRSEHGLAQR